jgi:hypothetical protein
MEGKDNISKRSAKIRKCLFQCNVITAEAEQNMMNHPDSRLTITHTHTHTHTQSL